MRISDRKLKILSAVVEAYVETGEPVSSKLLTKILDFPISSATIRNEMAELSELGYLEQPHTSAGRIPSSQGYRLYINEVMKPTPVSDKKQYYMYGNLNLETRNPQELLENALKLLASETHLAAIVTSPKDNDAVIATVRVIQITDNTGVVLIMMSTNEVETGNFKCDYNLNQDLVRVFDRVLNQIFSNISIRYIDEDFIRRASLTIGEISILMAPILNAILVVSKKALKSQVYLDGQTNLLFIPGFDLVNAKQILDFLRREEDILDLIALDDRKDKILIGNEMHYPELANSGVIVSKYFLGENQSGIIGVIGPTRMDYATIKSDIDCLAGLISKLFDDLLK